MVTESEGTMRATIDFDGAKVTTATRERFVVVRRYAPNRPGQSDSASIVYRTSDLERARSKLVGERSRAAAFVQDHPTTAVYAYAVFDTVEKRWVS